MNNKYLFQDVNQFNIPLFFSRYLCGGPALKECRHVSRKRLALASLHLAHDDTEANLLHHSIVNYRKAVNDFDTNKLNINLLRQVNKRFSQKGKQLGFAP